MNIIVFGGTGFIGSYLVDCLLAKGHRIRVFSRSPEKYRSPLTDVDYYFGDFSNHADVADALVGMDTVCHLISTTVPGTSNLNPMVDIQSNLVNTVELLEQMRRKKVRRIVFLSSGGSVYGDTQTSLIDESQPLNPISSHAVVKVAIEKYLYMYQKLYGIESVVLRVSNPYGPRQGHYGVQGFIGTALNKLVRHEPIEVWGDGSIIRDYIYIDDVVRLIVLAVESKATGVFNAGSGEGHSITEILDILGGLFDGEMVVQHKKGRSFDVKKVILDIDKAKHQFDWLPQIKLSTGVVKQRDSLMQAMPGL